MLEVTTARHATIGTGSWLIQLPLLVHVGAGVTATITGFVALSVAKGGDLHRRLGMWFVYAMLAMGLIGAAIAAWEVKIGSVNGGLLAAYLVLTAFTTVQRPTPALRRIDVAALIVALCGGLTNVALAAQSALKGETIRDGVPLPVYFIFGGIAIVCGLGDIRMLRLGGFRGSARLRRHLWRMCVALFVASASFFLGQAQVFPKPIRVLPLLAIPPLLTLVVMAAWLWRLHGKRVARSVTVATPGLA
jgi:uncharacterized membrane protein